MKKISNFLLFRECRCCSIWCDYCAPFLENLVNSFKNMIFAVSLGAKDKERVAMGSISKYDALKIKAVFLYVLDKMGSIDKLCMSKIVYFANKEHLARFGRPLINDDFIAMPKGPVPSFLLDAINYAAGRNYYERPHVEVLEGSFQARGKWLKAVQEADRDELSASDISCLDDSIFKYGKMSGEQLSDLSHLDKSWDDAKDDCKTPMDIMQMAMDAGASEEILQLIKAHQEFDKVFE